MYCSLPVLQNDDKGEGSGGISGKVTKKSQSGVGQGKVFLDVCLCALGGVCCGFQRSSFQGCSCTKNGVQMDVHICD